MRGLSKKLQQYKINLPNLTSFQKEALIGLALGDLNIKKQSPKSDILIRFEYTYKSTEYVNHLYNLFKPFILTVPYQKERISLSGNKNTTWRFQTISHSEFNFLYTLYYPYDDNKKHLPPLLIKNNLTPISLAYWFMDDGGKLDYTSNEGKGIVLNTQGFKEVEVKIACEELKEKFNLNCWVGLNKKKPVIKISGKDYENFLNLTNEYIIDAMKYKLPTPRK
jgi:hypothetical protein